MSEEKAMPLVSIGLPTYNRPAGLKTALEHLLAQSYTNIEIIISDNHTPDPAEVIAVTEQFADPRIRFFRQPSNLGIIGNFIFVVEEAHGNLFMWAADDDYIEDKDTIKNLVNALQNSPETSLAFPDFNTIDRHGNVRRDILKERYSGCVTHTDYIKALCRSAIGNPMYGLYRREVLTEKRLGLLVSDIVYFNEGIFLHDVFLNFNVKFVPGNHICYFSSDIFEKKKKFKIITDFVKYSLRLVNLYRKSTINFRLKFYCMAYLFSKNAYMTMVFMFK